VIDASGKTLLPGLIDTHAHISVSGTMSEDFESSPLKGMAKSLATQLYCGVTTVRSVGDSLSLSLQLRREIDGGERLGAELFVCGPMFTAKGGHGTEYFEKLPEGMRELAQSEVVRLPTSPAEAKRQVGELKSAGVDGVKVILEKGFGQSTFPRLERAAFLAIAEAARGQGLPLVVHTGEMADIEEALAAGAATIEHGSSRQKVPDEVLAALASRGIAYDPTLAVLEGLAALMKGDESSLGRGLATRVVSAGQRQQLRTNLGRLRSQIATEAGDWLEKGRLIASDNLLRAEQLRVPLIAGSDAGNPLVTQGPGLHRELRLWVEVGIKPTVALKAATSGAARALRAGHRIGLIKPGFEANLLLVEGNPLEDISATERIALVLFRGGRVNRPALLDGDVR
jgi:imidazolonepropionase-like amidohydrolase